MTKYNVWVNGYVTVDAKNENDAIGLAFKVLRNGEQILQEMEVPLIAGVMKVKE